MSCDDDCYQDGRDAYRRDRYSYETSQRLDAGRYFGSECDRDFLSGYRREERAQEEREIEEREQEEAAQRRQAQSQMEEEEYYQRFYAECEQRREGQPEEFRDETC